MWVYVGTGSLSFVANMGVQGDTRRGSVPASDTRIAPAVSTITNNTGLESVGAK